MAVTLCAASRRSRKYYFNPDFDKIPQAVKDELKIMCVTFTEDVGGIFTIDFNEEGKPYFSVIPDENDSDLDEIGAELCIRKIQEERQELMEQLSLFYKVFIKGEDLGKLLTENES